MRFRTIHDSELAHRNGQRVTVLGLPDEYDPEVTGPMSRICFADGYETSAFDDEVHLIREGEAYESS